MKLYKFPPLRFNYMAIKNDCQCNSPCQCKLLFRIMCLTTISTLHITSYLSNGNTTNETAVSTERKSLKISLKQNGTTIVALAVVFPFFHIPHYRLHTDGVHLHLLGHRKLFFFTSFYTYDR